MLHGRQVRCNTTVPNDILTRSRGRKTPPPDPAQQEAWVASMVRSGTPGSPGAQPTQGITMTSNSRPNDATSEAAAAALPQQEQASGQLTTSKLRQMGQEKSSSDRAGSRGRLEPARLEAALPLGPSQARAWAPASTPTAGAAAGCATRFSAPVAVRLRVLRLTGEPASGSILALGQGAQEQLACSPSCRVFGVDTAVNKSNRALPSARLYEPSGCDTPAASCYA